MDKPKGGAQSAPMTIDGRPVRLLVVDDNAFLTGMYVTALGRAGCDIQVLHSGENAHKIAKETQPSLILLDLLMPGKDGFEVLAELKKDRKTKNIPVFILSSLEYQEDTERALNEGADGYLKKTQTLPKDAVREVRHALGI